MSPFTCQQLVCGTLWIKHIPDQVMARNYHEQASVSLNQKLLDVPCEINDQDLQHVEGHAKMNSFPNRTGRVSPVNNEPKAEVTVLAAAWRSVRLGDAPSWYPQDTQSLFF